MFTVALIGPDGAGKTTVGRRLERELPISAKYLYLGENDEASNHMLPTTRLLRTIRRTLGLRRNSGGPPDPSRRPRPTKNPVKRLLRTIKVYLRLGNCISEEWYRQFLAWNLKRRGSVVIFDRHYFSDYYAHDIAPTGARPLSKRLHGWMLARLYPKPDLVICLDAPADVLFARKPEGTPALLERRRQEYLAVGHLTEPFIVVDATQSPDLVAQMVADEILAFHAGKTGLKMACHE